MLLANMKRFLTHLTFYLFGVMVGYCIAYKNTRNYRDNLNISRDAEILTKK